MPKDIQDLRRHNLKALIAQWSGPTNFAKRIGITGSYLSHLTGGHRPITEKTARSIETKLGMDAGWLDVDHGAKAKPVGVDQALVLKVLTLVYAVIEEHKVQVTAAKLADLITLVYEDAARTGVVDEGHVHRLVRLIK